MKYNGKELELITTPQVFNPPRWMIVSNFSDGEGTEGLVLAIVQNKKGHTYAISEMPNGDVIKWAYCAEPPKEEPKLATNHELARWLMEGNGEIAYANGKNIVNDNDYAYGYWSYIVAKANSPVKDVVVRKWDDTEWHEPTREYLGLEDK